MRTAEIDAALRRFEVSLGAQLAPAIRSVRGARLSIDGGGASIACEGATESGACAIRIARPGADAGPRSSGIVVHAGAARVGASARLEAIALAVDVLVEAARRPREPRCEPLDGARARALWGEEGALLAPGIDAFRAHYGAAPHAVFLDGDEAPSIALPDVAGEQGVLLHAPPPFREDARMRAYVEDLGFAIDARDRVSTVPLPSSFARRRARLGAQGGFAPVLVPWRLALIAPSRWLARLARGVLPINVRGRASYALSAPARALGRAVPSIRAAWNTHFFALAHDMGLHALAMHRIGEGAMTALRGLAERALARGAGAAARAAAFFEERLTRACCDLWVDVRDPDAFAARFDAVLPGLVGELRASALGGGRG